MIPKRVWLGWILLPLVIFAAAIDLIGMAISAAGQVIHPSPEDIPSMTQAAPSAQWSDAAARARRIVRAAIAEQNLPGLSVAVGAGGRVAWAEGFGWTDIKARAPVTPDTRFRIGTASTVLTSAAVGVLVEKGDLKLDDEIQTYVPQFPKQRRPVTLRQLMAHTSGVGTDSGEEGPLSRQRCEQPVQALQHFSQNALLFEPGTQYRHSTYGWILTSAAVEAAAGQPFLTFMRERVFEPLGMDNTGAESATEENPEGIGEPGEDAPFLTLFRQLILEPLGMGGANERPATEPAVIYSPEFGGMVGFVRYGLSVMPPRNLSCYTGSMAFFSTPSDLVRFGLALNGGTLLQPATVQQLQSPQKLVSGQETGHALGWELDQVTLAGAATQTAGHDGELLGRKLASLMLFREAGIVVAVTSNLANTDTSALALQVAEAFAQPARR